MARRVNAWGRVARLEAAVPAPDPAPRYDLGRLSDAELAELERLAVALHGADGIPDPARLTPADHERLARLAALAAVTP